MMGACPLPPEAQLGLLLGGGAIYYFLMVVGGLIFQQQKCFFKGLKSKKRKF